MRVGTAALSAAALVVASACAGPGKSSWEMKQDELAWKEGEISLPSHPRSADLVELAGVPDTEFRFLVDPGSVSVGTDGVVRYVLVAVSASSAENVSFEGIRCATGAFRVYATGHGDGRWLRHETEWRPIRSLNFPRGRAVLQKSYFCSMGAPVASTTVAIAALRRGGHAGLLTGAAAASGY